MATLPKNDPSRPTCRVVKRVGQRGARIHPPGCQVRAEVGFVNPDSTEYAGRRERYDPQGDYVEYTKRGTRKRIIKTDTHFYLKLLPIGDNNPNYDDPRQDFMWDSGATYVGMNGDTADYLFGVHWRNIVNAGTENVDYAYGRSEIADGSMAPNILLFNKSVIVRIGGRNERINTKTVSISIKGDASTQNVVPHLHNGYIQTEPDGSNLFGLSGIQALKDIKVKFRERQDQDFL